MPPAAPIKIHRVEFARPAATWAQLPDGGRPEVAFVGRSNVGKSSLLNALVGRRQLARTSQTPGKTQALNFFDVEAEGWPPFYLVDLPGYGYAKVAKTQRAAWDRMLLRYLAERGLGEGGVPGPLRVVVHLIDSRHAPTGLDLDLQEILRAGPVPFVIALTKSDKISGNVRRARMQEWQRHLTASGLELPVVATSAEKKTGLDELWGWVRTFLA